MRLPFILIILISPFVGLYSATVTWDGGGASDNWSEGKNWVGDAVPGITDEALIDNGDIVQINSVVHISKITIDSNSQITINPSYSIIIDSPGPFAISLKSDAEITNHGLLQIASSIGNGIEIDSDCTLTNYNRISINNIQSGKGILNEGVLINHSMVSLGNIDNEGIENNKIITNYDSICVIITNNTNAHGVLNNGIFHNLTGSLLKINNTTGHGIYHSGSSFNNSGIIDIDNSKTGIFSNSTFVNADSIYISNCISNGIHNTLLFQNQMNAYTEVKNVTNLYSMAIQNEGTFRNTGKVYLENVTKGLNNEGLFRNESSLRAYLIKEVGVESSDSIYNSSDGIISIDSTTGYGFGLINRGGVLNNGKIDISRIMSQGLYSLSISRIINNDSIVISQCLIGINHVADELINESTGVIHIKDSQPSGIGITGEFPSHIYNYGKIILENLEGRALFTNGELQNYSSGYIESNNIGGALLDVQLGATFECSGQMNIGN